MTAFGGPQALMTGRGEGARAVRGGQGILGSCEGSIQGLLLSGGGGWTGVGGRDVDGGRRAVTAKRSLVGGINTGGGAVAEGGGGGGGG